MDRPISIPNLIQGVSQQDAQQRRPTQADEQINCINSPVDGAVARPSSEVIAKLAGGDDGDWVGAFYYEFNRGDEHYVLVIRSLPGAPPQSTLAIYDLDTGESSTIDYVDDARSIARFEVHDVPAADDTVTIGTHVYTWKAAVAATADQVKIGATALASASNLADAINADVDNSGVTYGSATTANGTFVASAPTAILTITATIVGPSRNNTALDVSGTYGEWDRTVTSEGAWNSTYIQEYLNLITTIPERAFCAISVNDDILIANRNISPNLSDGERSPERPNEAIFHFRAGMYSSTYVITVKHVVGNSKAQATYSITTLPVDGDTVVIEARTYTFKDTLTPTANEVKIDAGGATADAKIVNTARNLRDAIQADVGSGTEWAAGTTANTDVDGHWIGDKAVTVIAEDAGATGNTIDVSATGTGGAWDASHLTGGGETATIYKFTYTTPDNSDSGNAAYITTNHLASTFYRAMTGGSTASKKLAAAWSDDYYDETVGDVGQIYAGGGGGGLFGGGGGAGAGGLDLTTIGFSLSCNGSAVHIWSMADDFTIDCDDGNGNTQLIAFQREVTNFSKLPNGGFANYVTKVLGDKQSGDDDYWVGFGDKTLAHGGAWQETVAPDVPVSVLKHTLPFLIASVAPLHFTVDFAPWGDRVVGDADSDPEPYLFGDLIQDMMFNNSRLGFLTQGAVTWSKAKNAFVLLKATVQEDLADDPISFTINDIETPVMEKGVVASEHTGLWARTKQYSVRNDNQPFKDTAIEIKPATKYEFAFNCRPLQIGQSLYMAEEERGVGEQKGYVTVRDLIFREGKFAGDSDVTAHVPQYVPAGINRMSGSEVRSMLFASSVQYSGDGTGGFGIHTTRLAQQPGNGAGAVMVIDAVPGPSTGDGGSYNFKLDIENNRAYRYRSAGVANDGNLRVFNTITGALIADKDHDEVFGAEDMVNPLESFGDLAVGAWTVSGSGRHLFGPTANSDPDFDCIYGCIDTETLATPFPRGSPRGRMREFDTDVKHPHQIVPSRVQGTGQDTDYFFIVEQIGIVTANQISCISMGALLGNGVQWGPDPWDVASVGPGSIAGDFSEDWGVPNASQGRPDSLRVVEGCRGGELENYSEIYLWGWNDDKISASFVDLYRIETQGVFLSIGRTWNYTGRLLRILPADIDDTWVNMSQMTFAVDLYDGNLVGIATNYPDLDASYIFKLHRETGVFLWKTRVGPDYDFPEGAAHFGPEFRLTNAFYGWIGADAGVNTIYRIDLADGTVTPDLNGIAEGFAGFAGHAGTMWYDGFSSLFFYAQLGLHDAVYTPIGDWCVAHSGDAFWDQNWTRLWLDPTYAPAPRTGMFITAPDDGDAEFTATGNDTLFSYCFFYSNQERVQSAWSKWTFPIPIAWHSMQRSVLRTIQVLDDGDALLCRTNCSPRYFDEGHTDYHTRFDLRLSEADVTLSYSAITDLTTVTLPWPRIGTGSELRLALSEDGGDFGPRGSLLTVTWLTTTTFTLVGDARGTSFYIGYRIRSVIEPSQPYARDAQGSTVPFERVQIADVTFTHGRTSYYRIEVEYEGSGVVSNSYPLPPFEAGDPQSQLNQVPIVTGKLRAPIDAENTRCKIRLVNDTHLPSRWLTMEWGYKETIRKDRGRPPTQ